jgi:hypothetical protein
MPKIRCKNAEIGVFLGKDGKPKKSKSGSHNILRESCQRLRGFNPTACEGCKIQVPGSGEAIKFALPKENQGPRGGPAFPDLSNRKYVAARDLLIDEAVRFADEAIKGMDLATLGKGDSREGLNMAWNRLYHGKMASLAEAKGLAKKGLEVAFRVQDVIRIRGFRLEVKKIKGNAILFALLEEAGEGKDPSPVPVDLLPEVALLGEAAQLVKGVWKFPGSNTVGQGGGRRAKTES